MLDWIQHRIGWPSRIRVRIADIGTEARALRRLITTWLPNGPDLRPCLQVGQVEIVVLHHVRTFGDSGPITSALTEQAGSLTRIRLGRYRPTVNGQHWQPYTPAEMLSALELHLQALARGYTPPAYWWPGLDMVMAPGPSRATDGRSLPAPTATGTATSPDPAGKRRPPIPAAGPRPAEEAPVLADDGWPDEPTAASDPTPGALHERSATSAPPRWTPDDVRTP
jgi:hypothetical protein